MSLFQIEREVQLNNATIRNNRYEGKFVIANVINLFSLHIAKVEIYFLSKALRFVPTREHINKGKIGKEKEIEVYSRKLMLI